MTPKQAIDHGRQFPFDALDDYWNYIYPPASDDWAHDAARGILADLSDRRGIKWELEKIDEETRKELANQMAAIIREAHTQKDIEQVEE